MDCPLNAPTAISPTGTISTTRPDYTFSKIDGSTQYHLYVQETGGSYRSLDRVFEVTDSLVSCGSSNCVISSPSSAMWTLTNGGWIWQVKAENESCVSGLSNLLSFTVSAITCNYSISPTSNIFTSDGGTGAVNVTAAAGCSWTATENLDWVNITSGGSGSGNGAVNYTVSANTGASSRTGTITIAGKTHTITQSAPAACEYSISPTSRTFAAGAGTGNFDVTTGSNCDWTAVESLDWVTITSGAAGSGNGRVAYSVTENTGATSRTGTITAAGLTHTITQNGSDAVQELDNCQPVSNIYIGMGLSKDYKIILPATADLKITLSNIHGVGGSNDDLMLYAKYGAKATVSDYDYDAIEKIDDTRTIEINNAQAGTWYIMIGYPEVYGAYGDLKACHGDDACTYNINPTSNTFTSDGGTGAVNVTAAAGCSWTATENLDWVNITSGGSGSGNGAVNYTVSANTGASSRTGTITIAGKTHTITQSAPAACEYSISPTSRTFAAGAGTGNFDVTTGSNCDWTAVESLDWVTITSGAAGSGNGRVAYSVTENAGATSRTGTITAAGLTHTITQNGSDTVQELDNCQPVSNIYIGMGLSKDYKIILPAAADLKITLSNIHGVGGSNDDLMLYAKYGAKATVSDYDYDATEKIDDTRTIEISNAQAGAWYIMIGYPEVYGAYGDLNACHGDDACTYNINPTSNTFTSDGGTGAVNVTAAAGCSWTATENLDWVNITSGGSGSGNGAVNYTVSANTGASSRTGTITIAGKTHTITQSTPAACEYSISPTSRTFAAGAGTGNFDVTTGSNCDWTAVESLDWVTITSGAAGSGNGRVAYSVTENTGATSRTGTITAAGLTHTISQNGSDAVQELDNCQPVSNIYIGMGLSKDYKIILPAAADLKITLSNIHGVGGSNDDLMLYAKYGAKATVSDYDYDATEKIDDTRTIEISNAQAGAWYIMIGYPEVYGAYGDLNACHGDDSTGPSLSVTSHSQNQMVSSPNITIAGTASDAGRGDNGIQKITINGERADNDTANDDGTANWSRALIMGKGVNTFNIVAYDNSELNNTTQLNFTLNYKNKRPKLSPGILQLLESGITPSDDSEIGIALTENDEIPFFVADTDGSVLAGIYDQNGTLLTEAIFVDNYQKSLHVTLDAEGRPQLAYLMDYVFILFNYSDNSVDISVTSPDGSHQIFRDVSLPDSDSISLSAEPTESELLDKINKLRKVFKKMKLVIKFGNDSFSAGFEYALDTMIGRIANMGIDSIKGARLAWDSGKLALSLAACAGSGGITCLNTVIDIMNFSRDVANGKYDDDIDYINRILTYGCDIEPWCAIVMGECVFINCHKNEATGTWNVCTCPKIESWIDYCKTVNDCD